MAWYPWTNIFNQGRTKCWSYESKNVKRLISWCLQIIKYATLEAKVHKYSNKEYDFKKSNWSIELQALLDVFQPIGISSHNVTPHRWDIVLLRTNYGVI
jgi:hypothetical protein